LFLYRARTVEIPDQGQGFPGSELHFVSFLALFCHRLPKSFVVYKEPVRPAAPDYWIDHSREGELVAFNFDMSREDRVATITVTGPVDLRECVRALAEFVRHPDFHPDHRVLVDLREMAEYPASVGEMRVLAWTLSQERAALRTKIALVLPEDSYGPRLDRVQNLNSLADFQLAAFPDVAEAEDWVKAA
jgi:hypothetical protein